MAFSFSIVETCIIDTPFYQASKPNINVAIRVYALATKAVRFGQQRLCFFLTKEQIRVAFVDTKNAVDFPIQNVHLLKFQEIY